MLIGTIGARGSRLIGAHGYGSCLIGAREIGAYGSELGRTELWIGACDQSYGLMQLWIDAAMDGSRGSVQLWIDACDRSCGSVFVDRCL